MRWPANSSPSCRVGHRAFVQQGPHAPTRRPAVRRAPISSRRVDARSERHPRGRVGGSGASARPRRSSAAAFASRRPWSSPPPPRRRSRCAWPCAARALRDVAVVLPADVRLRGDLPDAQRRPRAPARAGARALPGASPTAPSASASCPACACSARSRARGRAAAGRRAGARLVPLAVVLRPARDGRLPARCAGRDQLGRAARRRSTRSSTSGSSATGRCPTAPPWFAAEQGVLGHAPADACAG